MTATTPVAIDESVAVMTAMAALAYPTAKLRWTGKEDRNNSPSNDDYWFRWTMQHTQGGQGSLSCEHGERRWRREGLIIVQCFAPLDKAIAGFTVTGLTLAQRMAESARDAYQGTSTPSGVWFRNATTQEVGIDDGWYQVNATIQFTYDEVR